MNMQEKHLINRSKTVMETVWPWRLCRAAGTDSAGLRRGAVRESLMLCAAGGLLALAPVFFDVPCRFVTLGRTLVSISVVILITGLWIHPVYRFIRRMGGMTALVLGTVITWVLLVPCFFIFFIPGRIVMALRGRDPLNRGFPSDRDTYWEEWKNPPGKERYRQQF